MNIYYTAKTGCEHMINHFLEVCPGSSFKLYQNNTVPFNSSSLDDVILDLRNHSINNHPLNKQIFYLLLSTFLANDLSNATKNCSTKPFSKIKSFLSTQKKTRYRYTLILRHFGLIYFFITLRQNISILWFQHFLKSLITLNRQGDSLTTFLSSMTVTLSLKILRKLS